MIDTQGVKVCYEEHVAVEDFTLHVVPGEILSIIGPNGSGKSTVLRAMARLHPQKEGVVYLEGISMKQMRSRAIAQRLSIVSQYQTMPPDLTVENLVGRGRIPHNSFFASLSKSDQAIIDQALVETHLTDFRSRSIYSLSGGERQRAFIAMALVQQPKILLLDEPTTYLDLSYQFEVLELIRRLNQSRKLTIVMVLHDINQASRYSDRLAVINKGRLAAIGTPWQIVTEEFIRSTYRMNVRIQRDEVAGTPFLIPVSIAE